MSSCQWRLNADALMWLPVNIWFKRLDLRSQKKFCCSDVVPEARRPFFSSCRLESVAGCIPCNAFQTQEEKKGCQSRFHCESVPAVVPVMILMRVYFCFQAQLQRSLDSSVSSKPRLFIGRRSRREQAASTDSSGRGGSQALEQDSGILDVEDDEEDDEVRKLPLHTETHASIHLTLFNREVVLRFEISFTRETLPRYTRIGKQRQLFNFFLFNSIHSCFSRKQ